MGKDINPLLKEYEEIISELKSKLEGVEGEEKDRILSKSIKKVIRLEEINKEIELINKAEKTKKRNFIKDSRCEILKIFDSECYICKEDFEPILEIHHKIALSGGGTNNLDNLVVLCPTCHRVLHLKNDSVNTYWFRNWFYEKYSASAVTRYKEIIKDTKRRRLNADRYQQSES